MPRLKVLPLLSLAATLSTPAFAQYVTSARPGTLNYIEGQATLAGQPIASNAVGSASLAAGQVLQTENGKAELLLTPGVFLRLGSGSAVRMVSPSLTRTEIALERGEAQVEVDELYKGNLLLIDQGSSQTQLLQKGLYSFNTEGNLVRVYKGKALTFPQSHDQKGIEVKGGRELALNATDAASDLKPDKFDKDTTEDALYRWSSLRSQYLGQANAELATGYAGSGGGNPGWGWDPGLYSYTWLPGSGAFLSPFGYGFYSPSYLYGGGGFFGGGNGFGGYGYPYGGYGYGGYGGYGGGYGGGYRGGYGSAYRGGLTRPTGTGTFANRGDHTGIGRPSMGAGRPVGGFPAGGYSGAGGGVSVSPHGGLHGAPGGMRGGGGMGAGGGGMGAGGGGMHGGGMHAGGASTGGGAHR